MQNWKLKIQNDITRGNYLDFLLFASSQDRLIYLIKQCFALWYRSSIVLDFWNIFLASIYILAQCNNFQSIHIQFALLSVNMFLWRTRLGTPGVQSKLCISTNLKLAYSYGLWYSNDKYNAKKVLYIDTNHLSLFLRVQLTITHHWFRWWLGAE